MTNETKKKRGPKRWRKARWPEQGTRWATPMNHHVWYRNHGQDVELWQDKCRLATVKPDGCWHLEALPGKRSQAANVEDAKTAAKAATASPAMSSVE